jgi:hypothetical protein
MSLFDPRIEKHLIADQGEVVIDEVRKHWAAVVMAMLEMLGGVVVLALTVLVPAQAWWVPVMLGGAIVAHAAWRILERRTDRFVITNMRVFRVHGILTQNIATMPLSRILDISVHKPIVGRVFGYGHFVFESAAQEQGLREIRFVGDPDQRGLTIQRVIQQAGLRGLAAQQQLGIHQPAGGQQPTAQADGQADQQRAVPPIPPMPSESAKRDGWDWLADAQRREVERLAELRGEDATGPIAPYDPDRTNTAPIDLPR